MKINSLLSFFFVLAASAEIAIGRIYDERLSIYGFNLSILISVVFFISSIFIFASFKKIIITSSKVYLLLFFASIVLITPILWTVYGAEEYGVLKFFNFVLIAIPLTLIILEKFDVTDVKNIFILLLGLSFLLLFLAVTGLFETPRADGRISILGGGPIIFGRWMGFGVLALFFLPLKRKILFRIFFISLFIIYCLISGSRGPFTALIICFLFYLFINFKKIFLRFLLFSCALLLVFFSTNFSKDISKLGRTDRVFLNVSKKGGSNQSTQTRYELLDRSFKMMYSFPIGVGAGNWQMKANEYDSTHLMAHEYPHNLFLEIINEYGILTGILLLIFIIKISFTSFAKMINHRNHNNSLYPFLFFLWIFLLINSMISGSLNDSRLLFVVASCIMISKPLTFKVNA